MTDEKKDTFTEEEGLRRLEEVKARLESFGIREVPSARGNKFRVTGESMRSDGAVVVGSVRDTYPSSAPTTTLVDGKLKIGDSPLVTEALERIRTHKDRADSRPAIPADVLLVRSARVNTFEETGRLPLDEQVEVVPRVNWEENITLRGLFSIQDWQTRWNAVKIGARKLWAVATGRWT